MAFVVENTSQNVRTIHSWKRRHAFCSGELKMLRKTREAANMWLSGRASGPAGTSLAWVLLQCI